MTTEIPPAEPSLSGKTNPIAKAQLDALQDIRNTALRYIDMQPLALLHIQGEDAESFLQGQLSNDISQLGLARAQLHAWCNPKGRALAILRVMRSKNGFRALLPGDLEASITKRLKIFVMRAKVTIETESGYRCLAVAGADNAAIQGFAECGCRVYCVDETRSRYLLIGNRERIGKIAGNAGSALLPGDYWRALDILAAIPQVYAATTETFIPQHINLELVDGVSFRKGCYPGQEIVARLKYLGKSKKRLIVARIDSSDPVAPGDAIYASGKPGSKAGAIVDSVALDNRTWLVSAMAPATAVGHGALAVGSAAGGALEQMRMPYAIPGD